MRTFICGKCKDGECKILVPEPCEEPVWCPFGLYPESEKEREEFAADWQEQTNTDLPRRQQKGK